MNTFGLWIGKLKHRVEVLLDHLLGFADETEDVELNLNFRSVMNNFLVEACSMYYMEHAYTEILFYLFEI